MRQAEDGTLGVAGVFAEEGAANSEFQKILDRTAAGQTNSAEFELVPSNLLPANSKQFHYMGSLTALPLTEGVE